jgi:hypothetical protein
LVLASLGLMLCFDLWLSEMIPFSEPERHQLLDFHKLRMDQAWRKGLISNTTYVRSLFNMGYFPNDAITELNHLKLEKGIPLGENKPEDRS